MKKQILFLTFFIAAIFAGMNVNAQYANYVEGAATCTPAIPLTCITAAEPVYPLPGQVYTYEVTVTAEAATTPTIHWFVTTDVNVIAVQNTLTSTIDAIDGDYVLTADVAKYNVTTNTSNTIDISWKYFPATPAVLLVAYVVDEDGCTDNIEVYRIEPTFGFTLDVVGMFDDGSLPVVGNEAEECVSPVESAIYDGTANLTMNYGENWVYFSVNAANFVDSWMPDIQELGYTGAGTVSNLEWAYPDQAILNAAGVSTGTWNATTVPVEASGGAGAAVGSGGECIVLRARIDHGTDELDYAGTGSVLTIGIDGIMSDPSDVGGAGEYTNGALADLDEPAAAGTCVNDVTDEVNYNLTPRPQVETNTVGVITNPAPFETKN